MDKNRKHKTERILKLTLEIIYILTGEDYTIVKISGELVTSSRNQNPITVPTPQTLIRERDSDLKILELTNKINHLLTGEVCLEGQDNLESNQPLTSQDFTKDAKRRGRSKVSIVSPCCLKEGQSIVTNIQTSKYSSTDKENTTISLQNGETPREEDSVPGMGTPRGHMCITSTQIKKEPVSCEVGNHPCVRFDPTPIQSTATNIKDRVVSHEKGKCENHKISTCPVPGHIKEESVSCKGGKLTDIYIASDPSQYPATHIKEESASSDEGNLADRDIHPFTVHSQYPSTPMKEESISCPSKINEGAISCDRDGITNSGIDSATDNIQNTSLHTEKHEENEQKINSNEKPFSCSECGKCFKRKIYLNVHRRIHTGDKPYSCSECGKCFSSCSNFISHRKIHTGEKTHFCSYCGKCFYSNSKVLMHERIHTGEKPYCCSECGKCFIYKSDLIRHHRIHTGEKPYSCSECGKCFTSIGERSRHQAVHTGEKPYSCSECGKCFGRKSSLVTHHKTHTGEKPYPCTECGKQYSTSSHLAMHQRLHNA